LPASGRGDKNAKIYKIFKKKLDRKKSFVIIRKLDFRYNYIFYYIFDEF